MQFGAIVGNYIVIAEPSYFPIVLFEDAKVCSVNQFPTMCGLPNLCSIKHYYLHGATLQQFLLYDGSGYFQHDVTTIVSDLNTRPLEALRFRRVALVFSGNKSDQSGRPLLFAAGYHLSVRHSSSVLLF